MPDRSAPSALIGGRLDLDRGVWTAPFLDHNGCELLEVIHTNRTRLFELRVPKGVDKSLIERHAWAILNLLDPEHLRPALSLVPRSN